MKSVNNMDYAPEEKLAQMIQEGIVQREFVECDKYKIATTILKITDAVLNLDCPLNLDEIRREAVYTKVKAPAGIYGISGLPIGDITEIVEKHDVIIGRCLTSKEYDPFKGHFLAQHKKGQNIKSNDESMLLLLNNFEKHYTLLENAYKAYDKKIEMFKPGEVDDEDVVEF